MNKYQCTKCSNVRVVHDRRPTLFQKCCDGENPVEYKLNNQAQVRTDNLTLEPEREVTITVPPKQVAPKLMTQSQNVAATMNTRPVSAAPVTPAPVVAGNNPPGTVIPVAQAEAPKAATVAKVTPTPVVTKK